MSIDRSQYAIGHAAVTPSDSIDLAAGVRALYIGTGGDLVVIDSKGASVTYKVQSGQVLPLAARRVMAAGTTATNIVAWF